MTVQETSTIRAETVVFSNFDLRPQPSTFLICVKRLTATAIPPTYGSRLAAGMDLHADLGGEGGQTLIQPGERKLIPSGIALELDPRVECQVRARSGLALKHGIALANGVGTVDPDYRGDVGAILINLSHQQFVVRHGDRIAQLVIAPFFQALLKEVEELGSSERGANGYGSTGVSMLAARGSSESSAKDEA